MNDETIQPLLDELAADPDFANAATEHAEGTSCDDGNCWGCRTVSAIHNLSHWDEEDPLEFAMIECADLESTLRTIAQVNRASEFLSAIGFHAAMFALANEFDEDEDDESF